MLARRPDMAGGIDVPDAERFLEVSRTKHFNILLHEMAHAYDPRGVALLEQA